MQFLFYLLNKTVKCSLYKKTVLICQKRYARMPWNLAKASRTTLAVKVLEKYENLCRVIRFQVLSLSSAGLETKLTTDLHYANSQEADINQNATLLFKGPVIKMQRHNTGIRTL